MGKIKCYLYFFISLKDTEEVQVQFWQCSPLRGSSHIGRFSVKMGRGGADPVTAP